MKYWETKNGDLIPYKKIGDNHLINILRWIKGKAQKGMILTYCGGGWDIESMWFDEQEISGKEVLEKFDYKGLLKEAKRRKLKL